MNSFKKIIEICEKNGFLKKYSIPRVKDELFHIGPFGALLQENLRTEWIHNTVVNKEFSVFLHNDGDFLDSFNTVKECCLQTLPFGLAEFSRRKVTLMELAEEKDGNKNISLDKFFENSILMKCVMFVAPSSSTQFFHHWQRYRRMWWRKVCRKIFFRSVMSAL